MDIGDKKINNKFQFPKQIKVNRRIRFLGRNLFVKIVGRNYVKSMSDFINNFYIIRVIFVVMIVLVSISVIDTMKKNILLS